MSSSFGPYQLIQPLGTGGMAETFLAVRRGPGGFEQQVCLKRILPAYEEDPEFIRQFMDEARLAAKLRHANIVQVIDFGVAPPRSHYLALELVDGIDLRQLMKALQAEAKRLPPAVCIYIAVHVATALEFAHGTDRNRPAVVHRDVSPSNILLSRAGEVYLTDFGIARAVGSKRRTKAGFVRGKTPYLAPEYIEDHDFDARCDLFALGVTFYEMLCGRRPFDGASETDTLTNIRKGLRPSVQSQQPEAEMQVVHVIDQLLQTDPSRRFQNATAVINALVSVSPGLTAQRTLRALVQSYAHQPVPTFALSSPSQTTQITRNAGAPTYPDVRISEPDAATHSHSIDMVAKATLLERGRWASTDPARVSHHGQSDPISILGEAPTQAEEKSSSHRAGARFDLPTIAPAEVTKRARDRRQSPKRWAWLGLFLVASIIVALLALNLNQH